MTLIEQRNLFRSALEQLYSIKEIDDLFKRAIMHFFSWPSLKVGLEPNYVLNAAEENQLNDLLDELVLGRPFQYCLGISRFMELDLVVGPGVLIPRPETEELTAWVLSEKNESTKNVWDICTGSGCIALALKYAQPDWLIKGFDVSTVALELAKENAKNLGLNVSFEKNDLLDWHNSTQRCDLIVSNPPYVLPSEKINMHTNVVDYEPALALFVPEEDPLLFYRKIFEIAASCLSKDGQIYVEINPLLLDELIALGKAKGFSSTNVKKDIFEKDRFVKFSH